MQFRYTNKAASIISYMIAILESRLPLDKRPNMVQEIIRRDYAMQKYIAETGIASKSDVSPNTPRVDKLTCNDYLRSDGCRKKLDKYIKFLYSLNRIHVWLGQKPHQKNV